MSATAIEIRCQWCDEAIEPDPHVAIVDRTVEGQSRHCQSNPHRSYHEGVAVPASAR